MVILSPPIISYSLPSSQSILRKEMTFLQFLICMYSFLSASDMVHHILKDDAPGVGSLQLPASKAIRFIFYVLNAPSVLAVIALPIYGFFVMRWWQPILGLFISSILGNVLTRKYLAGSDLLYLWSSCFSLFGIVYFIFGVL